MQTTKAGIEMLAFVVLYHCNLTGAVIARHFLKLESDALGMLRDCKSQIAVEDFGMPLNLMLGCSAVLVNSEEEGVAMLRHCPASARNGTFDTWLQARVLD